MIIDYSLIGQRIRNARMLKKLSQERLAEKVDVAPGYISKIENGRARISLELLMKVSYVLNVEAGSLLTKSYYEPHKGHEIYALIESCSVKRIRTIVEMIKLLKKED